MILRKVEARIRLRPLLAALLLIAACRKLPPTFQEPRTGLRFVLIPAGRFAMGSPAGELGHRDDETLHSVTLTRPFYVSTTEVTQEQWRAVMGDDPSHFRGRNLPVESVTWFEVQEFLRRLSTSAGRHFRLPTEAEWEYACRAGSTSPYSFGAQISTNRANYDGRYPMPGQSAGLYRGAPTPVASFPPNAWGLYDMHGNVWEWCADEYCPYPLSAISDPLEACGSPYRVIRGGSWYFGADSARSALRYTHEPRLRGFSIGFRVACDRG
ncbi:MAG TPA: formylglycine-generating enzyme family protein [Thermoanaerobaculia bacterium]|nr:formylglycine-generating enzyme family protein [Thermoanaerobaculia bacterium]